MKAVSHPTARCLFLPAILCGVMSFADPARIAFGQNRFGILAERAMASGESSGTLFLWREGGATGGPNLDEPIVTDRPDFTEASVTVGQGVAQVESGYTYFYNNDDGESVRTQSFGEPLFRYGMFADWFEVRVALFPLNQRTIADGDSDSTAGLADLYTGVKFALTPQDGFLPEMALVPQMNIPTGSDAFSSDTVEPGVNWLYGWDINDCLATGGSTQANRRIDDTGDSYVQMAQSWTINYSLAEGLGAYTEWFALIPSGADTDHTEHYFDGGFTYLVTDNVQLDLRAGVGLNDAADDYFIGTGLSFRVR